ncbi:unnamed protein product [Closterium sp. NIES-54]
MYALSFNAEGDCYRCVPPDPGIAAAALGASVSGTPPVTAPAEALHTFTLDSGASRCFFRDSTTLTPLSAPVLVRLADPSGGPVIARSSTVLPCPAVPSGSLSGLHLPSFSTNLVNTAALHDAMVTTTTPGGQCVSICTCTRTGRHLAMFTRRPGSSLYTQATKPAQVTASDQVSTSGQVDASCSCRLLLHQTLLWHHRLGHPSLPHLRGMHSRLLVSGLPRSLPPLPPSPAPPCLPCVEGRQRPAPHSSFPPMTAPMQTLYMDVWGPARVSGQGRECYFLLVVDDYMRYTTVFPLRSKGEVSDVLIPWICTVRLQLRERFGQDLPVLRLHSDRGGEFSSDLLRTFVVGRASPSRSPFRNPLSKMGLLSAALAMEVARTSMIHAAAPHFLWPFAVRYLAHQLNLWPRVSLPETSPTLRWTGMVGDASVFRSDPFYRLFPYRSAPPPPPLLFLAPIPPQVDPLPPQGAAPGVASGGAALGGAASRGAEPGGAGSEGAGFGGAEPEGVEPGVAKSEGAESGGSEPQGARDTGARVGAIGAGGAGAAGVGAVDLGAGGAGDTVRPRPCFVPLLQQPAFPLPTPSPYTEQSRGLTERREPASRLVSPVPTTRRTPRSRPPPVPGTHTMALPPSSDPLRVPLPAPPESSLPEAHDPESDRARAANPTLARLLATAVTDPYFESAVVSALVAGLLDFAAACRLDYAIALVAESVSASTLSVGGECALGTDVLEDRQEDCEFLAAAIPPFASMLLAPEGDPDAPDIPTPCSYAEAITDASWVDDSATHRSSQGYTFSLGFSSVSCRSTRSSSVLNSNCEAEIYAGAMAAQELRWLTYLLTDLGEQPRLPPVLYVDNKAMIALCLEHRLEHRTKHIALRYFVARELQQRGQLRLAYVATRANTTDVFTKALPPGPHDEGCILAARKVPTILPKLLENPFPLIVLLESPTPTFHALRDLPNPTPARLVRGPLPSPPIPPIESLFSSLWSICSPLSRATSPWPCWSRYHADGLIHLVLSSRVPPPLVLPQPLELSLTAFHYLPLVTTVAGFASSHRLDYVAHLVSGIARSPSSEGAFVFPLEALKERQFELGFFAAVVPHLCAMLLAFEGDPDALDIPIPRNHSEAVSGPWASYWIAGEEAQMASYRCTCTYVDAVPPPGANVVSGMWLDEVKWLSRSPLVFKAQYVARGFSQREVVDFFQTFAPAPKMTILQVLLHMAAQRDYELHSLDFSTAFLQESLHK